VQCIKRDVGHTIYKCKYIKRYVKELLQLLF
jgi:hypothetical protein